MSQNTPGVTPRAQAVTQAAASAMLDDLAVVGVRWQRGSAALTSLVLPRMDRGAHLESLFAELRVREMLYLATCNRVQLAFLRCGHADDRLLRQQVFDALLARGVHHADPSEGKSAEESIRAEDLEVWRGLDALAHLSRVASGLDSALIGEREIRGQLRDALRESTGLGLAGAALQRIVSGALQIANRVHESSRVGDGRTSLAEIALEEVERHLENPSRTASKLPVALIGVSDMTRRCAERLHGAVPLLLVNRTASKATSLARSLDQDRGVPPPVLSLEDFRTAPSPVAAAIVATGADGEILDTDQLDSLAQRCAEAASPQSAPNAHPPLVIDFGVPANIDLEHARRLGFSCLGMDEISRRAAEVRERRSEDVVRAEAVIAEGVEEVRRRLVQRSLSGVLKTLSERYRETAVDGLERMFERELDSLEPAQQELLVEWAHHMARRLAHVPILGLRGLAAEEGNEAVATFLRAADPSLLVSLDPSLPANGPDSGGEAPPPVPRRDRAE